MQRYFAIEKKENKFILKSDDYYHIKTVMRMKINEQIEVVYDNIPYLCRLVNNYEVEIEKQLEKSESSIEISLLLPLLKEQKMDFILQKATELGVKNIILYNSKRSIIDFKIAKEPRKIERWNKICKEASEQSKRCDIPSIIVLDKLSEISKFEGLNLICSTLENKNTIKKVLQSNKNYVKINLIVGPEGGFDPQEERSIIDYGFKPITLGNTILRVETVPIMVISSINYEFME